jgi:peptidoglycan hydrolase-like protein with peptidoglycan-binding domain
MRSVAFAGARRRARLLGRLALFALLAALPACKTKTIEEREREAADAVARSLKDVDAMAMEQKVDPAVVKEVQQHLTAIHEYQGEINGKLDQVTINAVQAFERAQDLEPDGIIDEDLRKRLTTAAGAPAKTGG